MATETKTLERFKSDLKDYIKKSEDFLKSFYKVECLASNPKFEKYTKEDRNFKNLVAQAVSVTEKIGKL